MSQTVIRNCVCKNPYQDKKYGKGKRVFNMRGGKRPTEGRCSSCGFEKEVK